MLVKCLCTFIHGRDTYTKDEVRQIDESLASYFAKQGWVESKESAHTEDSVDLTIQSGVIGLGDSNG